MSTTLDSNFQRFLKIVGNLFRAIYIFTSKMLSYPLVVSARDFLENLIDVENINFVTILISYEQQLLDVAQIGRDT